MLFPYSMAICLYRYYCTDLYMLDNFAQLIQLGVVSYRWIRRNLTGMPKERCWEGSRECATFCPLTSDDQRDMWDSVGPPTQAATCDGKRSGLLLKVSQTSVQGFPREYPSMDAAAASFLTLLPLIHKNNRSTETLQPPAGRKSDLTFC